MVTEVKGHTEINPCVIANTSQMSFKANRSQVNLLLEMTSENCTEAIDEGSLYLRGVCMASNKFGSTSETFVLGVFTTNYITTVSVTRHVVYVVIVQLLCKTTYLRTVPDIHTFHYRNSITITALS